MASAFSLVSRSASPSPAVSAAMTRLVAGPAAAIWNSSPAVAGCRDMCDMPPKMNSVIRGTGNPRRRATSA